MSTLEVHHSATREPTQTVRPPCVIAAVRRHDVDPVAIAVQSVDHAYPGPVWYDTLRLYITTREDCPE